MACKNVADKGPGYGVPSEIVDGNDVLAVNAAARKAIARARAGEGPTLIECKTFRMTGHSAHDPADYVPKHLWTEWDRKDPIGLIQKRMRQEGWATQEEITALHTRVLEEVREGLEWADKSPYPDAGELCDNVYESREGR
jgi:pyruvate dehydrogenase E1 component alpha subunit